MQNALIREFRALFNVLQHDNLALLEQVYAPDIHFQDPFHEIQGLNALSVYFQELYENLLESHFIFHECIEQPGESRDTAATMSLTAHPRSPVSGCAFLTWTMTYRHPKIAAGRPVSVEGSSLLHFNDRIYRHRDYFDAGAMLYEHIPVLGYALRHLKRKMQGSAAPVAPEAANSAAWSRQP